MAVGDSSFPDIAGIKGVRLGTACAGIRQLQRDDVLVVELPEGAECAGVFTRNAFCAAPVIIARNNLLSGPRWLLVNSGNANAGTGESGMQDAQACCSALAGLAGVRHDQVLPFSTGVIGEDLPVDKIASALPQALANLAENNWLKAAQAIMTTDTFPKGACRQLEIEGKSIAIAGISKGAGMIQPDMATMLAFIATDASMSQAVLQNCLQQAVEKSFNRISVDGDTSTNDACMLTATGKGDAVEITENSPSFPAFVAALTDVFVSLAEAIVRDGEGATKLIRIVVDQALDTAEAVMVGKTIAHSPLVKTAFFASDPNWGRILAAIGRAGIADLDINAIEIFLDDVCIVRNGGRASGYQESAGQQVMDQDEITVLVRLNRGAACEQVMTCDLSYDYVRINAEYRT